MITHARYAYTDAAGNHAVYRDRKRAAWLMSVLWPLSPLLGIAAHAWTGHPAALWLPVLLGYVVVPLLDWLLGEDPTNPPEVIVPGLEEDRYYRILTMLTVPLHWLVLGVSAWWIGTQDLGALGFIGLTIAAGSAAGLAINTAHELGHKKTALEQVLASFALAVPGYGHFNVEHNRGHHRHVATPEDLASARMGESIYRFALREIPGALRRGWRLEAQRLASEGHRTFSTHNTVLRSYAMTLLLQGALVVWGGWQVLLFLVLHNLIGYFQLTSANYIEHYGLLRRRGADGKVERCQPHHSWNSNHIVSNLLLYHLQRHSDHHAWPTRRYQSLRDFEDLPRLPSGYSGMFLLAYLPPIWFRVMDPRLVNLPHVGGDFENLNLDPSKAQALRKRYGSEAAAA